MFQYGSSSSYIISTVHIPHLPATFAFSINAITASNPFSCAKALVSVTNFFIKPAYLLNSGDLSSVIELNNLQASSYPARRAFHTCKKLCNVISVHYFFHNMIFIHNSFNILPNWKSCYEPGNYCNRNAYLMLDFFVRWQFHPFTIITHFESILTITYSPDKKNPQSFNMHKMEVTYFCTI